MDIFPDADMLLGSSTEELAFALLHLAKQHFQGGLFHRQSISEYGVDGDAIHRGAGYPGNKHGHIRTALAEGWSWLEREGFLVPASGMNGQSGFRVLGRKAEEIKGREDFSSYLAAAAFPKSLLHPSIADKVWMNLARGDLADAVFIAFRSVEEAVRKAGGFTSSDIGVALMRKAFDPTKGPLRNDEQHVAEREALMHLFAGSIGSYKNPHSHRTVTITDPRDAQEMVVLASHLLRIIDARTSK